MWQSIEQFIVSVPIWVWVLISFPIGWWIGGVVKKVTMPATAGTLWVIRYADGSTDHYLEMSANIPPDKIIEYTHLLFDVKIRELD